MRIQVLHTPRCPHAAATVALAREVAARLAPEAEVEVTEVASVGELPGVPAAPLVRVDGLEVRGEAGVPPAWLVEAAVLRALSPRFVLFLCVANAARSQMAEGLGRALAPEGVQVGSAGSAPARRSERATRALAELGIDITAQHSKGMDAFAGEPVDAVITLCAEEVCPAWLGRAHRVHWGLPDPGKATGTAEEQMAVFRAVRDEIRRRLEVLFGQRLGAD